MRWFIGHKNTKAQRLEKYMTLLWDFVAGWREAMPRVPYLKGFALITKSTKLIYHHTFLSTKQPATALFQILKTRHCYQSNAMAILQTRQAKDSSTGILIFEKSLHRNTIE